MAERNGNRSGVFGAALSYVKTVWQVARIAQKINLVRTRSQCDTGVIQDGFIRRYSIALERGVFLCGEGVSPGIFRMKGPFDFILLREGLRERSNPLIPQEQRP